MEFLPNTILWRIVCVFCVRTYEYMYLCEGCVFMWRVVKVKVHTDIVIYRCCMCVSAELIIPVRRLLLSSG